MTMGMILEYKNCICQISMPRRPQRLRFHCTTALRGHLHLEMENLMCHISIPARLRIRLGQDQCPISSREGPRCMPRLPVMTIPGYVGSRGPSKQYPLCSKLTVHCCSVSRYDGRVSATAPLHVHTRPQRSARLCMRLNNLYCIMTVLT